MSGFAPRRVALWVAFLCLGLTVAPPTTTATTSGAQAGRESTPAYREGELILQFKASATAESRQAIRDALGTTRVRPLGRTRAEVAQITKLTVAEAVARFKDHPDVEWIEPDFLVTTQLEPNDTSYEDLWGLSNTGPNRGTVGGGHQRSAALDQIHSAPDVLVAIIDTGVTTITKI